MGNVIILLVGRSASGKSTVCKYLEEKEGWKVVKSYTTRPMRPKDKNDRFTHAFVGKDEFDALENKCAYTYFDGCEYCATSKQVDESDIYVIDPKGVKYFREHYVGRKRAIVVCLDAKREEIIKRMKTRGDSKEAIEQRLMNDAKEFDDFYDFNYLIPSCTTKQCADIIKMIKERKENEEDLKRVMRRLP